MLEEVAMSDETPNTPYRDARDPKRAAENDLEEVGRGSQNTPSDIERAAEPTPTDPEMGMNYTHDDPDRQRDGVHAHPLTEEYENVALRDDLIRRVDDTVAAARNWARETDDENAQEIVDLLVSVSDRLGRPVEDTDRETHMDKRRQEPTSG
jgi:hypothetical protein